MAKVKAAVRALDKVLDELPDHIEKLHASGLRVTELEFKFSGSLNIDRDGGLDLGVEASLDAASVAAGVPVSIKTGVGSRWDNQGAAEWEVRIKAVPA